jgi:ABC-type branched-subunit amino acid transport system substrate-binding protein
VVLASFLAVSVSTCGREASPPPGPTIAFLFDGSAPDEDLVMSPALEGLELAARQMGGVHVEPVDVGDDPDAVREALDATVGDHDVLGAVVAPWTPPPPGAIERLGSAGIPVISLSWAWGPPSEGVWRSIAPGPAREAVILLSAAGAVDPTGTVCLASDDEPTSRALFATARDLGVGAADPPVTVAGIVRTERGTTATTVADRVDEAGCAVVAWIGGAEGADALLAAIAQDPALIGTSRVKTDDGLLLASSGRDVRSVCPCVDVSLSVDEGLQRFVHDFQADGGSPPGPYAVEAYDAGRLLIGIVLEAGGGRRAVAAALDEVRVFTGLTDTYRFAADGSRAAEPLVVGDWRARGSRWLPIEEAGGAP